MNQTKRKNLRPATIIPLTFLVAILVGAVLLALPVSTAPGERTSPLTALFTATTSVCVTGLVVVDTFSHWSMFGQAVILVLIQLGGLGVIAISSAVMLALHKKLSMSQAVMLQESFNLNSLSGLLKFLRRVVIGTLIAEGVGALLYMIVLIPRFGGKGIWYALFLAVSAFCNAGMDLLGPDSLIPYRSDALLMSVTSALIILGGLGYVVWFDILKGIKEGVKKRYSPLTVFRRFSEHTKLVLTLTAALLLGGMLVVLAFEFDNPETIGSMSFLGKLANSFFQSVTFRTAGFASIPQDGLREHTAALGCLFMFIGGSPVGTAGGVKTVTFFVVLANAISFTRNRREAVVFDSKLSDEVIRKSTAIVTVSFCVTFFFALLLGAVDHLGMSDASYEVFSATATVGLSRSLTPRLSDIGKSIIILCMYLGRIGPISMAVFFGTKSRSGKNSIRYAEGKFFAG